MDTILDPSPDAYKGKLVILTDGDTASAAEEFAAILQASGRAIVVGENTNGSTGTPYFFDLPGGGRVRISTLNTRYPNGNTFKGAGIEPDVRVLRTIHGIAEGRDEVLKAALDYVHSLKLDK
jgi:C-terminal processing protease CtpA/Prc